MMFYNCKLNKNTRTINFDIEIKDLHFILPQREKTCLRRFANNTGADQTVHLQSDQRLFNHFLKSTKLYLATGEI